MADQGDEQKKADFLVLEAKIRRTYSLIQEAREKLKEQREMFESSFENDPVYQDHEAKHRETKKVYLATRQQILKDPAVVTMKEKVGELRLSLKELEGSLSEDLWQYQNLTGEKVIETEEGELMEIINRAKLARRS